MRAYVYDAWGGAERLRLTDLPEQAPKRGQLRVSLEYAGVNPADWKFLAGKYRLLCKGRFPRRAGMEGAGTVIEAGPGVRLPLGSRVTVTVDPTDGAVGTWAEQVVIDAARVCGVPDGVSMRDAAVLPIAGLTAWKMCSLARVGPGTKVLVTGASGGVGSFAVQIAKALGAEISATAGEANLRLVKMLGADHVIDYRSTPAKRWQGRWDAILDCVNTIDRRDIGRLLAPNGALVDTDPQPVKLVADRLANVVSRRPRMTVMVGVDPAGMADLLARVATGQVRPLLAKEYAFADAAQAVRDSLEGHSVGKRVLRIAR